MEVLKHVQSNGSDLFLSSALWPASNMLGRWSIDGVFTMRRVPGEHQAARFSPDSLIGIETLGCVIYAPMQHCKDRSILENIE